MSLTSLLRQHKEFRALIDAGIPREWHEAFRAQIPSADPKDNPPEALHPIELGLLSDFAIRKLFRDQRSPCRLLLRSETGMIERVAGAEIPVPGDPSRAQTLVGVSAPTPELLWQAEAWLEAYVARPLPDCLVETIMLSYAEACARSGRWDATPADLQRKQALLSENRATIWAWLEPILAWAADILAGAQRVVLNPSFGKATRLARGADADLWIDGDVVEIKCVRRADRDHIRQLIGYAALASLEGQFWADNLRGVGLVLPRQQAFVRADLPPALDALGRQVGDWLERHQGRTRGRWR